MKLNELFILIEKLQKKTIGKPVWIPEKQTFEYTNHSVEVVAILKIIRAAQGIKSLSLLCENGLLIDLGAIYRCVNDCCAEVYFLLEEYPQASSHVEQFIKAFFETTIDVDFETQTEPVLTKKIHNAMLRVLTGLEQDEETRQRIVRIHKIFSGYIHSNYAHILQIYGGSSHNFNLGGVTSIQVRQNHMQLVNEAYKGVLYAVGFIAKKLNLTDLHSETITLVNQT